MGSRPAFLPDWERDVIDNKGLAPGNIDRDSLEQQEKERYRQDTVQRRSLATWVVWVDSLWLLGVMVVVFLCGFGLMRLEASVLNVLFATTTANVLGLAYIVLEGLFKGRRSNK